MTMVQEVDTRKVNKHRANVVYAVKKYHSNNDTKVSEIATCFGKTENEITNWFCEAIEKEYIAIDDICGSIIKKHIEEYENKHKLTNSYLRLMYEEAVRKRKIELHNM